MRVGAQAGGDCCVAGERWKEIDAVRAEAEPVQAASLDKAAAPEPAPVVPAPSVSFFSLCQVNFHACNFKERPLRLLHSAEAA